MTALLQTADRAVPVANDVSPASPYRATVHALPPISAIVAHRNGTVETMIFVEEGIIELVINGHEGYLSQGEFARIAPGAHFAYRNKNTRPARLLTLPVLRAEASPTAKIVTVAAA